MKGETLVPKLPPHKILTSHSETLTLKKKFPLWKQQEDTEKRNVFSFLK